MVPKPSQKTQKDDDDDHLGGRLKKSRNGQKQLATPLQKSTHESGNDVRRRRKKR
jgi:hypothetical protein